MPEARDLISKVDTYFDKPFVRAFIRKVQDIDPDIGAVIALDKKMLVFIRKGIIIYKVILDKENLENIPFEKHIENIRSIVNLLKTGFVIPSQVKKDAKRLNLKYGKRV